VCGGGLFRFFGGGGLQLLWESSERGGGVGFADFVLQSNIRTMRRVMRVMHVACSMWHAA
jgi:hypothetical protein